MIHYHGVDGIEAHRLKVMHNRHCIISFAYPRNLPSVADICSSFCLDNGAYSFWRKGKETNWDAYYEWVDEWHKHPAFDFALIPDVIDGDTQANIRLVNQWQFGTSIGVPVWHLAEDFSYLKHLLDRFPKIAFGSSGEYGTVGSPKWWNRMAEAFNYICGKDGRPPRKIHMLRGLNLKIFPKLPFHSADSSFVSRSHTIDAEWTGSYVPPKKTTRLAVLCERIESFQSAPCWVPKMTQRGLFE